MEIHYEPDERIIATTIPPFDRGKKACQTQFRLKEDGTVTFREFRRRGIEFEMIDQCQYRVPPSTIASLVSSVSTLLKISDTMPVVNDSGAREIALNSADGVYESIQFPNGGGRKHPNKASYESVWRQLIDGVNRSNSEQDVDLNT